METRLWNRRRACVALGAAAALTAAGCGGGVSGNAQDSDPVVVDYPIAYVQRPLVANEEPDLRNPAAFSAGGDLYVRDRATGSAPERNVTSGLTQGLGDVRDLEPSFDGRSLLFSMRLPDPDPNDDEVPTWNIWEYTFASGQLRRVIESDIDAEVGEDLAPHYLPDGRIVFSSTRQRQAKAVLIDESKSAFAALDESRAEHALSLHVMNGDGSDIHQITFNQSHDLDPTVLSDGRILFSRWDHMGGRNEMHLYTVNPDGTDLQLLYGAHSHGSGTAGAAIQFTQPREMPDGGLLAVLKPFTGTQGGGDVSLINASDYVDNTEPLAARAGLTGPAQVRAVVNDVRTDGTPSPGGRFSSAYPLYDGTRRLLVTWSPCRLLEGTEVVPCTATGLTAPNVQEAPPLYGLWIYDMAGHRQAPVAVAREGIAVSEAVLAQARSRPGVIYDRDDTGIGYDSDSAAAGLGILHIRSVYDMDGSFFDFGMATADATRLETLVANDAIGYRSAGFNDDNLRIAYLADPKEFTGDQRPARFLRLVKAVSVPDRDVRNIDNSAFGVSTAQGMREILGYAPIEPDGSVKVKVPANVAFTIEVLDKDGNRISSRHRNWLQLRPGETLACNGCHTHAVANGANPKPHGRSDAVTASINRGALADGVSFANTEPDLVNAGATMAETRFQSTSLPNVDLRYLDVWTDEAQAGRLKDAPFTYTYRDVFDYTDVSVAKPVGESCIDNWSAQCRVVIHYETHIHPLWQKARAPAACTACHTTNGGAQVPDGQLDLTDGPSDLDPDHFKAYRELLATDLQQELSATGTLQNVQRQATDPVTGAPLFNPDGSPVMEDDPAATVTPPMSLQGARASRFFAVFAAGGTHAGRLTPAELKLLAEWLDNGAQYYNDPFDAPAN